MPNNENNEAVNPISENQAELENGISEDNTAARGVEATPPPPICLEDDDVDMETQKKFMETKDVYGVKRSISNMCSDIILEPDINMDTSDITRTQKRQRYQQQGESKWRHKGIKRSHKEVPFVSYEELEDNLDDLDQPNQLPARTMQYHDRGRKTNSSYPGTIVPGLYSPIFQHSLPPPHL